MAIASRQEPSLHVYVHSSIPYKARDLQLEKAVCSNAFFMMAPTIWCPETKTLQRPLRHRDGTTTVLASITHSSPHLCSTLHHYGVERLSEDNLIHVLLQVSRMLSLSKDFTEFHEKHPQAKKKGFCRLFRSPTLFEDAVKCILLSNCTWKRTLSMAEALCNLQPTLASMLENQTNRRGKQGSTLQPHAAPIPKGKTMANNKLIDLHSNPTMEGVCNFPSSRELAMVDADYLNTHCNLGYRSAKAIIDLAISVESGKLDLERHERSAVTNGRLPKEIKWIPFVNASKALRKIKGIGPLTCANILTCIGYYHKIPIDSETIRLVRKVHGRENCTRKTIENDVEEIYGKYEPYQYLAYRFELLKEYESRFGKLSKLPSCSYHRVRGSMKNPR